MGDFMIDEYIYSKTERISPEAPVLIANVQNIIEKPGGAGNVAQVLLNLQDEIQIIGFGDYENKISEMFPDICIKSLIPTEQKATRKTRIISDNHHLLRIDHEQNHQKINGSHIEALISDIKYFDPEILIISDYNKGFLRLVLEDNDFCKMFEKLIKRIPIIADLKPSNFHFLHSHIKHRLHSILPNQKEIIESADFCKNYYDAAVFWHEQGIADHIIVTRGENGASMVVGFKEDKIPVENIEVVDICGCGDNVTAVYGHLIAKKVKPLEALKRAVKAATLTAHKLGTHPITLEEFNSIS